jgi:glycosyltransferase involved in cell wall biosynthesis
MTDHAPAPLATLPTDERLWHPADLDLSVVVPFYNPGAALRPTVSSLLTQLRQAHLSFEVIAVSDGSTDGSEHTLTGLGSELRVIVSPQNEGKGGALARGLRAARGEHLAFIDADGDLDPAHVVNYVRVARQDGHDVVYADKRHPMSSNASSGYRRLVSVGFSTLVTVLFALGVRDTQTGCKVFRRDVVARVLPRMRERGFAFDLEFFVAARSAGVSRMHGAPVSISPRTAGSTVTGRAVVRMARAALRLFGRRMAGAYTVRPVLPAPRPALRPAPQPALQPAPGLVRAGGRAAA